MDTKNRSKEIDMNKVFVNEFNIELRNSLPNEQDEPNENNSISEKNDSNIITENKTANDTLESEVIEDLNSAEDNIISNDLETEIRNNQEKLIKLLKDSQANPNFDKYLLNVKKLISRYENNKFDNELNSQNDSNIESELDNNKYSDSFKRKKSPS